MKEFRYKFKLKRDDENKDCIVLEAHDLKGDNHYNYAFVLKKNDNDPIDQIINHFNIGSLGIFLRIEKENNAEIIEREAK